LALDLQAAGLVPVVVDVLTVDAADVVRVGDALRELGFKDITYLRDR
jgi:hypothetical protein